MLNKITINKQLMDGGEWGGGAPWFTSGVYAIYYNSIMKYNEYNHL